MGVQSLRDRDLALLNRDHGAQEALACLQESLAIFPASTSADLIFGRPGQNLPDWEEELEQLCELELPHLSLYQLTLERATPLAAAVAAGKTRLPPEEQTTEMYLTAVEGLAERGLARYEVSSFARPGGECRHNLGYWSGAEWAGLGPGAHGRLGANISRTATTNIAAPAAWCGQVERLGHGVRRARPVPLRESLLELLATGLRTAGGVKEEDWGRAGGGPGLQLGELARQADPQLGLLLHGGRLALPPGQINLLDSILPSLVVTLDTMFDQQNILNIQPR